MIAEAIDRDWFDVCNIALNEKWAVKNNPPLSLFLTAHTNIVLISLSSLYSDSNRPLNKPAESRSDFQGMLS